MRTPVIVAALAVFLCLQAAEGAEIRRFALIVGSNTGGAGTESLRYAASDARAFSSVLLSFGGLAEEDQQLLSNPGRGMLSEAFASMRAQVDAVRKSGARTEFVFYYSGHSDDEGLLLSGERFGYDELRDRILAMASEVRLVVLDSCSSGAITRFKGGVRSAPFIVDTANLTEGQAFLTSSTAEEASQESDAIRSSFFSNSLVNGLRGAADADGDGKVTLNEAYQYAYSETLARTEKGAKEAQHPAFDIRLTGTGNLILTDLRSRTSRLILPPSIQGRIAIRDMADRLVVELQKVRGRSMDVGLEPGAYTLTLSSGEDTWQGDFTVRNLGALDLDEKALRRLGKAASTGKGPDASPAASEEPPWYALGFFPVGITLPRVLDFGLVTITDHAMPGMQLSLLGNFAGENDVGFQLSIGFIPMVAGSIFLPIPMSANYAGGNVAVGQVSFWGNWAAKDLSGVQVAVGANVTAGSATGLQLAAAGNVTVGTVTGLQLAVGVNIAAAGVHGIQVSLLNVAAQGVTIGQAGALNIAAARYGAFQVGGLNFSSLGEGILQASYFGNLSVKEANWAQVSFGVIGIPQYGNWPYYETFWLPMGINIAGGDIRVGQVAGLVNVCAASVTGVQIALGGNYATRLTGLQAGILNVSLDFTGAQIGLVNFALRGAGTQIGVLNISNHLEGVPVGILDIQGNGENRLDLWSGSTEALQDIAALTARLDFRFGSRWFYKYLGIGISVDDGKKAAGQPFASVGMGLGVRIPMLENQLALLADAGLDLCAFSSDFTIPGTEDIRNAMIPAFRALTEVRANGFPFGVLFGVQGRAYVDGFSAKYRAAAGSEATINWFGTNVYVQPRLFIGLSL